MRSFKSGLRSRLQGVAISVAASLLLISGGSSSSARVSGITLTGVPHVGQLPNYCGPAALSSLLAYWGVHVNQKAIGREVYDERYNATNGADLLLFAREEGFSAYSSLSTLTDLKKDLDSGFPILILQDMSRIDHRGHFRVVVGYDDKKREFLVRDPNFTDLKRFSYRDFDVMWSAFGRWAMVVCPQKAKSRLPNHNRENAVCHLDLGIAYLRRHERTEARFHLLETLRLQPDNEEAREALASLERVPKLQGSESMRKGLRS